MLSELNLQVQPIGNGRFLPVFSECRPPRRFVMQTPTCSLAFGRDRNGPMTILGIDPKNDFAFKRVFGSEHHPRVLIHLLNAVLDPAPGRPASRAWSC